MYTLSNIYDFLSAFAFRNELQPSTDLFAEQGITGDKLFKTKRKKLNSINVEFDFFSVVDRPERPLELITYDDKQKIIYIPVVGDEGQVTKKNILYQLKDRYFEFIGIGTGVRK